MFVGHFAVAFGAKKFAPRASLGTLILGAQLVDLLWPIFLLLGWESVRISPGNTVVTPLDFVDYPFTHSLVAAVIWAVLLGLLYFATRRDAAAAAVLALAVASHWVLDFISHRPDLPLWPGGPRVGLGLWNSMPATLVVELALFVLGVALYLRATRPLDRVGVWALVGLVAFVLVSYFANLFGPPPPSEKTLGWFGLLMWLFPLWGFWVDRHRAARALNR